MCNRNEAADVCVGLRERNPRLQPGDSTITVIAESDLGTVEFHRQELLRLLVQKAEAELKISLRTKQVEMALDGNVTMLIWLGKQMLGQKEKLEHSDEGGANPGPRSAEIMPKAEN